MFGDIGSCQERGAGFDGAGGEVLGQLAPDHWIGDDTGGGDLLLHLAADVGRVPRRPLAAEPRQYRLDELVPVKPTDRRDVDGDTLPRLLEAESVQLVDPPLRELGAILGDDLVGSCRGPRSSVPGLPELGPGFLVRVVGSPLGFVALDVVPDLRGPGAEGADVRSQLGDLTTGQIERVAVAGERGAEVRVAHDRGVSHAVDRAQAVADPDGVDPTPSARRPDPGVDLQVQVPVRVAGPRRVVAHDRGLDLLDRHLDLPTPRTDPCRRVLRDPADDLLSRPLLRRVVGLSDLGMQGGGQRPRLRAVHRDLDEPNPLRVRP